MYKEYSNVYVNSHPLVQHKISMLRNKNTGTNEFRKLIEEIAMLMGYEALSDLPLEDVEIETPIETCMTTDFADTAGKNAGLEDNWSDPGKMKADIGKCMDSWEQNHDYSDADCRMTAFLLLDGVLRAESTEDSYEGTYLMFDTEAIDNVDRYESIKENKNMFTTLYGEKSVTDGSHPENTFSDSWKHYGFQVDSDRLSLLSIVIYDPYSDVVFVGHTGVLIKYSDYYLFIEKIAFEQPYQATRVNNMDELLDIMSLRPEYFGEEGEAGPFVYCN